MLLNRVSAEQDREDHLDSGKMTCPKCGSPDVRRSKNEGLVAFVFQLLGRWPFRCRSCRVRFYRSAEPPIEH